MKAMTRIASQSFIGDRKDTAILSEKECLCFLYFDPTAGLMDMRNGFIETIGNTPLIRLQAASDATGCEIPRQGRVHESRWPGNSVRAIPW
jgi:hypothetical protein